MGITIADQNEKVQLKRELGLFSAVNFILAIMIGSGVFVSPASALKYSGSVGMCIVVWLSCGIISLLGALAYSELGTLVPRSGSEYAYFMDSFGPLHKFWGPLPSFIYSWIMIMVIRPAEIAVLVLTFSQYLCQPILEMFCFVNKEDMSENVYKIVAIAALGITTYINVSSVKLYVKVQNIFGVFKIIACLIVICGGIYQVILGETSNLDRGFEGTTTSPKELALAFYSGLWAYDGWSSVTVVTEELKKPEVNIPRSIYIAVPLVTLLYVFMNISYMTVLTPNEMIRAQAVAVTYGERILGKFSVIIPIGVALSTFGCALSLQFGVTRVCYVSGQDGFMLESLSYVHYKKLTPSPAVVLQGFISFLFISTGEILELIEFASFLIWFFYGVAMVSLIVMRSTMKDAKRPYKVPIVIPVFILLVALYLCITPIILQPSPKYLMALGFMLLGVLIYYLCIYKNKRPKSFLEGFNRYIQFLFLAVPPETN
ncbi:b(0,+)-type amino acid transporter 1-like isoform X2 [Diorhabda carinulata]|uniref:b(0,+)-type amino acid transporter 1-like isoform X2 n=1 Tax=Diorhabda sublineata TaxID=1163346 RepID=UPI0024E07056|nr:b(0,+)-type amino acid transporter 1-like isoform X2 [Diorhabda sublineata]XP_057652699.1 b(0,+)-type amino acid transporter 1-like isoform X2 [Diorhabda carinulata]